MIKTVIDDGKGSGSLALVNTDNELATHTTWRDQVLGRGDLIADAWGIQKVSLPASLLSARFTYDVDPSEWFTFENGSETLTPTNIYSSSGAGVVYTDATYTSATLESRECPRYQGNRGHLFSTAVWCPSKEADVVREWGLANDANGVFFRLKSDGLLYAVLKSGGVERFEELIDTSAIIGFDVEKSNTYDIQFQWRSAGDYFFYIGDKNINASRLVHVIRHLGRYQQVSMENPALPVKYNAEYTSGSGAGIYIGCVDVTSENGDKHYRENYVAAYAASVAVTTDTPVIVVYNPTTIGGKTNTRNLNLSRISFSCSKKAVFKVWLTRDGSAITGDTLVAIGNGSYTQCDSTDMSGSAVRATSVTTSSMQLVTSVPVEAATPREVDNPYRDRIHFHIVRGDYLVITCTAATATADVVVEFGEQR